MPSTMPVRMFVSNCKQTIKKCKQVANAPTAAVINKVKLVHAYSSGIFIKNNPETIVDSHKSDFEKTIEVDENLNEKLKENETTVLVLLGDATSTAAGASGATDVAPALLTAAEFGVASDPAEVVPDVAAAAAIVVGPLKNGRFKKGLIGLGIGTSAAAGAAGAVAVAPAVLTATGLGAAAVVAPAAAATSGLYMGALIAGGTVVGVATGIIAAPAIISAAGFTSAGVALGSLAASIMSACGPIAAGSTVATLQSIGAAGLGAAGTTIVGAVGGLAGMGTAAGALFGAGAAAAPVAVQVAAGIGTAGTAIVAAVGSVIGGGTAAGAAYIVAKKRSKKSEAAEHEDSCSSEEKTNEYMETENAENEKPKDKQ